MIFDSHAHLMDGRFDSTRQEIIDNFSNDNICGVCEIGWDITTSKMAVELAHNNTNIWAVVGTHPAEVEKLLPQDYDYYRQVAQDNKVVAIGEIGLDYHYENANNQLQKKVFIEQLQLADEVGLPVVLHIRDAMGDCLEILKDNSKYLNNGVLFHCYAGSPETVKELKKLGCKFALGGVITFKNSKKDDVIKAIGLEDLLLETDCPYLAPMPYRGQDNQPKYIELVARKVAEVMNVDIEEVLEKTCKNAHKFYHIV